MSAAPMPEFRVIVVPYELGRLRHGVGRGRSGCSPRRRGGAGIRGRRRASRHGGVRRVVRAHRVRRGRRVVRSDPSGGRTGTASASPRARFPCCSAGSCFNGVGVVAGPREPSPGVVWLDAHSDFNTPRHGDLRLLRRHGAGGLDRWSLARAARHGAGRAAGTARRRGAARRPATSSRRSRCASPPATSPDRARAECRRLTHCSTRRGRSSRSRPASTCTSTWTCSTRRSRRQRVSRIRRGITGEQLADIAEAMCREFPVRAVSLTAYDPGFDPEERVPPIAMEVLRRVAATAVSGRANLQQATSGLRATVVRCTRRRRIRRRARQGR